jgi:hypothetical protein
MRTWPVPVQLNEPEKIFGGLLDLRQLAHLLAWPLLLGGLGAAALFLPAALRLLPLGLGLAIGAAFAFARPHHMPLDRYLWLWWRWRRRPRFYYLRGDE